MTKFLIVEQVASSYLSLAMSYAVHADAVSRLTDKIVLKNDLPM